MASTSKLTLTQLLERAKNTQQTAARQQTSSIELLVKALEKLASESTAKEERIAELVREVASLKASNEDKDRKLAALQTSTNERINTISRELHPGGCWEWVWEGESEGEDGDEAKMGAGRIMFLAMKQELADKISVERNELLLRKVVDQIEHTLPLPDGLSDTVELDINSLPDSVVFELYDLVVGVEEEEEEEESRNGSWSWSLKGYTFRNPETTVNASRSPPPSFNSSLPIELADMIISFLDNEERNTLCLTSFHFLGLASRSMYNAPTMDERQAALFANGRLQLPSSRQSKSNRIRALLTPSTIHLSQRHLGNPFPTFHLKAWVTWMNGVEVPGIIPSDLVQLPRIDLVSAVSVPVDLSFWAPFLRLVNPLVFSITSGSKGSRHVPPTITQVSPSFVKFTSAWDRLEEVVASGAGSVVVVRGGKGDKIAFGDCLERSRENEKPQVVDYVLETRRLGKEEVEVERVSKWASVATRLGQPAPTLVGDEVGCCFRMWA